jgi:UDP-glucose 4-epimerase
MNILITGGCGFIGSHLANFLADSHAITVVDNFLTGKRSNIVNPEIQIIEANITDQSAMANLFEANKFDVVYHLAAIASVQQCKFDPVNSSEVNARSTLHLLDLAASQNVGKFIFASSAAVYGDHPEFPKTETSPIAPISIYGIDKYASEQYVMEYARLGKIEGTAFRFFNVFGPNQDPSSPYSGVLSIFHNKLVKEGASEVTIFGDGSQTRDFIFIEDLINVLQRPLQNSDLNGDVINAATGLETSLLDVVKAFEDTLKRPIKIDFQDARLGDIKHSLANITRLKATGFSVKFPFARGLKRYIEREQ